MTNDPKFVIKSIPGKGTGVVATSPITKGEVVLSEAPLFIQPISGDEHTIAASLSTKTADERRQFFELKNCSSYQKLPRLEGIFKTNAFPCGSHNAHERAFKAGIFLQGSRFNSSCVPNVNHHWNEKKQVFGFRAMRDIEEGEELCISYTSEMKSRADRQSDLQEKFAFECHCDACSLSGDELRISDFRRVTLGRLYDESGQCGPALGVQEVKAALRLMKVEGLVHSEDALSYDAFQFCVWTSDLVHAKAWAQKAWKAASASCGEDSEPAMTFKAYMEHPNTHRSWGRYPTMTLEGPDD